MTTDAVVAAVDQGAELVNRARETGSDELAVAQLAIRWAHDRFGNRLCLLSSMGDEALVHLASQTVPGLDVVFLDTGYHFPETLGTRDAYAVTRPINLINVTPRQTVAQQDAEYGPQLHDRDPDLCCALRKVEPLNRALVEYDAWISGMRREDAVTRSGIDVVEYDSKRDKVKLNPFARWTTQDVEQYAAEAGVMLNPLREAGYASIGCAPCTKRVGAGADPRSGRWAGTNKTECGLHT